MRNCIFFLLFLSDVFLYGQSLHSDTILNIKASTVYIQVKHRFPLTEDKLTSTGSGFLISPYGYIITNYHVIQPVVVMYEKLYPAPLDEIRVIRNSGTDRHRSYMAKIIKVDKKNDLALLWINDSARTPFLSLEYDEKYFESMSVWALGYPLGEEFAVVQRGPEVTVSKGFISALRHDDTGRLMKIQFDAVVKPGNSGGPLINESGKVLGVVNMTYGTSRIDFAVPNHFIKEMLEGIRMDSAMNDRTFVSIISEPPGATVFIDSEQKGTTPYEAVDITPGFHAFCIMKKGYESHIIEKTVLGIDETEILLQPDKRIIIPAGEKNTRTSVEPGDIIQWIKKEKDDRSQKILMDEPFNDLSRFNHWEQYTGGTDERTWFMEEGVLHQHESNNVLHAITLGDTLWSDYYISAGVKISDDHNDSRAGLIFRDTRDGFYLFRIHKQTNKAQLAYHSKNPFGWFVILDKTLSYDIGDKWYSLSVFIKGNTVSCYIDREHVFSTSAGYSGRGKVGFYSVESKASFDSLLVTELSGNINMSLSAKEQSLQSFWFSDYFNQQSTWWYQYVEESDELSPWFLGDYGCSQIQKDNITRVTEFTKYRFSDFSLLLDLSTGKKDTGSYFDIFFRKEKDESLAIRFSADSKDIRLLYFKSGQTTTLAKSKLPDSFFNGSMEISLIANGGQIICISSRGEHIDLKSKKISLLSGSFGFRTYKLPVVLHQMTVTSVQGK